MRPSTACGSKQFDSRWQFAASRHATAPNSHTRRWRCGL